MTPIPNGLVELQDTEVFLNTTADVIGDEPVKIGTLRHPQHGCCVVFEASDGSRLGIFGFPDHKAACAWEQRLVDRMARLGREYIRVQ